MRWLRLGLLLTTCALLSACVTGEKFSDAAHNGLPLAAGEGRIYFYRDQLFFGMVRQPAIDLNGRPVASCAPNGVAAADVPPGRYQASVGGGNALDVSIVAGEEKFIRCSIAFDWLTGHGDLELVDPAQGRADIAGLAYTGETQLAAQ